MAAAPPPSQDGVGAGLAANVAGTAPSGSPKQAPRSDLPRLRVSQGPRYHADGLDAADCAEATTVGRSAFLCRFPATGTQQPVAASDERAKPTRASPEGDPRPPSPARWQWTPQDGALEPFLRFLTEELRVELASHGAKLSQVLEGQAHLERSLSTSAFRRVHQPRAQTNSVVEGSAPSCSDGSGRTSGAPTRQSNKTLGSSRASEATSLGPTVSVVAETKGSVSSGGIGGMLEQPQILDKSGRFVVCPSLVSEDTGSMTLKDRFEPFHFGGKLSKSLFGRRSRQTSLSRKVIESSAYEFLSCLVLWFSAVFIGIETQSIATSANLSGHSVMNAVFDSIFVADILLRLRALRMTFFTGDEGKWNVVDAVLVILCASGNIAIAVLPAQSSKLRSMTAVRPLQLMRTMRMFRTIRSVREFRKMAYALVTSLRTLCCSLVLLFFVLYFFGIVICQAYANHKIGDAHHVMESEVEALYGDLMRCFLTLFMAVTNGVSWRQAYEPVTILGWEYCAVFLVYVSLALFGVMNVVTSVFVESAVLSAQHSKDLIMEAKQSERDIAMGHMRQVFHQIDEDGSGEITAPEMEVFLQDPSLRKYVEALEINAENARMLFRLLDKDGSKKVDIEEFCEGCMRLQGDAKSFDIHMIMFQNKQFLAKWSDFTVYVEDRFAGLDRVLSDCVVPSRTLSDVER